MSVANKIYAVVNAASITLMIDGKSHSISDGHVNFKRIKEALKAGKDDLVRSLVDVVTSISTYSRGLVEVRDGVVYFAGNPSKNVVADRILALMSEGFKIDHLTNFLEKLMANPSKAAVDELYLFLEKAALPITEDGDFLAYKIVGENYRDLYTGKFDNSVGQTCVMARSDVDDDRNNHCSRGLHFCSQNYLPHYGTSRGTHVMIVKINPADVVSIPSDYDNAKGRTWKYVVVDEATDLLDTEKRTADYNGTFTAPVYSADGRTPLTPDLDLDGGDDDTSTEVETDEGYIYESDQLVAKSEAADYLGISKNALRKRIYRGTVEVVHVDGEPHIVVDVDND